LSEYFVGLSTKVLESGKILLNCTSWRSSPGQ
jgi:hypothetical protein